MNTEDVNSQGYWERRFREDWEELGGPGQSRFFSRVALNNFPEWLRFSIRANQYSICDWGCAEGSGTAELSAGLSTPVVGIDFSDEAVRRAESSYPYLQFLCRDLFSEDLPQYDVVFSSNTLEHFHAPWAVFDRLAKSARAHIALLLPYEEYERIPEHFHSFDGHDMAYARGDFLLTHAAIEDTSMHVPAYWPGKQILVIYTRRERIAENGIVLSNLRIDSPSFGMTTVSRTGKSREDPAGVIASLEEKLREEGARLAASIRELTALREQFEDERATAQSYQVEAEQCRSEVERIKSEANKSAALLESQIALRGELSKAQAQVSNLLRAQQELDLIKSSRSWRLTRPLRMLARVIRHGGVTRHDREQLRLRWRRSRASIEAKVIGAPVASVPVIQINPQNEGARDVFVWSVIDWHFRIQRPQHLARELAAAGHRVFYISNDFLDDDRPGFKAEPLDDSGRLFRVQLHLKGRPSIYHAVPTHDALAQLRDGVGALLQWSRSRSCISMVQHPYWLETARLLPNAVVAYDCMDHHGGFSDNSPDILAREADLMRTADLLVVTSDWLYEEAGKYNPNRLMVRNACQYDHFADKPGTVFSDAEGRRIIGYYGAIAEWFDLDLIEKVALKFKDCLILLVGADTAGAKAQLAHLSNVRFTGEVPYSELPFYLYAFDVCLLPFKVIPLTLATNPVKVYEYLSAGKDVVSIDLPEISQFGDLVRKASDHEAFLEELAVSLEEPTSQQMNARRRQFASEQTWAHRAADLTAGLAALPWPKVSVIVVTYNNIHLTVDCLTSLERYSDYSNLEIIVVDNASADETPKYLTAWADGHSKRRVILNDTNRGFAAANNQGLEAATGEYLVLLNNDTYVTPGWVAKLMAHLRRNPTVGLVGPVTNNIGNEARIDIQYEGMEDMLRASADYTLSHAGQLVPLHTAAFFCVMMPRAVYEKVGPLDEAFGIGTFEDDDYCRRVASHGWAIACADDVFIHHHLSASFNKLKEEAKKELFERNKAIYEAKWGAWVPHRYR